MKSWYRSDVLQRMVTRLPNVPVYPSRTPETKIVSCLCTIVAGATVLWTFFQTGSSVVQRKGGSEQLATSPEVCRKPLRKNEVSLHVRCHARLRDKNAFAGGR